MSFSKLDLGTIGDNAVVGGTIADNAVVGGTIGGGGRTEAATPAAPTAPISDHRMKLHLMHEDRFPIPLLVAAAGGVLCIFAMPLGFGWWGLPLGILLAAAGFAWYGMQTRPRRPETTEGPPNPRG